MKHEYTEKQKETIRGAAMLIMAQLQPCDYSGDFASKEAIHMAKKLIDELIEQGLCD